MLEHLFHASFGTVAGQYPSKLMFCSYQWSVCLFVPCVWDSLWCVWLDTYLIIYLMKQPNTAKWKQLWCDTLSPQYEISNNSSVYFAIIPSMCCIINHHMSYHMLILAQNMHQTNVHSPHDKSNVSPTISPYHTIISSIHRSLPWPSHLTPYHRTIAPYHGTFHRTLAPYHRTTAPHHRMHPTSI